MQPVKHLWRGLFFILLIASLCGAMVLPVVSTPARAAPQLQATSCVGTTIAQWTFEGNVTTPSTGFGTFSVGSGLPNPTFAGSASNRAVSFDTWPITFDTSAFLELAVPTSGRNSIVVSFDYRATSTAPTTLELHYSANGTDFVPFTPPITLIRDATFHPLLLDLSAITELSNNPNAAFRLYGYGASTAGGTLRFDNITFTGNCLTPIELTDTAVLNLTLTSIGLSNTPTNTVTATNTHTATNSATATSTAVAPLTILINEVAWSGTAASTNDEWFELYNPGSTPINLNGWRLQAADGNPNIPLSGTILPGDYFVVAPDAGIFNTPLVDLTYPSGSFNNNGEVLSLLDPTGNPVDTANSAGGNWPAGTASPTYASMERKGLVVDSATAWSTYGGTTPVAFDRNGGPVRGTPGQANWITTVTATPTVTPTLTLTTTGVATTPTPANVVISEFRTTGPNGGNDEFVEIYNRTTSPVSIASWEIRKSSGCGTSVEKVATIPAGVTLNPGQHYLIGGSSYSGSVTVNLTSNLGIADTGGIALFQPGGTAWVDAVGLCSSTTFREGTALTQLTGNTNRGYDRKASSAGICVDTNNNINDFFLRTPSDPQNLASPVTICGNPTPTPTRTPRPTPTRTNTPVPPPPLIAINEFVPRPGHDWNGDSLINFGDEYIELINHGVIDVNLSGYTLDDEVNIGSPPFRLPADVTMKPGERRVFFAGETGLRLSDGGDGVRLLKPNGQLGDAYNYTVVRFPDQSYCRLPDNGGLDDWNQNCYPTPNLQNSLNGTLVTPPVSTGEETACPFSDTFPQDFAIVLAECPTFGDSIWNAAYWDRNGWFGERFLPESPGKWNVFVD